MTKKFRFLARFSQAVFKKHQKLLLASFLIGGLTFWVAPRVFNLLTQKHLTRIGEVGRYQTNQLPDSITSLIGQGLTIIDEHGQPQPLLAESWEIQDDGKKYVFTLKQDLFWHDGTPVKAQDIDYHFADVATVPLNDQQVAFQLKQPYSPFLAIVARPVFKDRLLGTGPYRVEKSKISQGQVDQLQLSPVDPANKQKILFRFYPTQEALKTAFKLGHVDVVRELTQQEEFSQWPNLEVENTIRYDHFAALFFNTLNPKFEEKGIRQALAYATQKPWPNRALGPINPNSWAFNPSVKKYDYDLAKAQQLWKKNTSEDFQIETIQLTTIPSLLSVAEMIKKDWQKLGVETKIKLLNSPDEEFEVLLASQAVGHDPDQYLWWHSTQPTNITGYKSFKIDNLLEEGRKEPDLEKRKALYQDFQRFLTEDSPAVFLFHPTLYTIRRI